MIKRSKRNSGEQDKEKREERERIKRPGKKEKREPRRRGERLLNVRLPRARDGSAKQSWGVIFKN